VVVVALIQMSAGDGDDTEGHLSDMAGRLNAGIIVAASAKWRHNVTAGAIEKSCARLRLLDESRRPGPLINASAFFAENPD